MDIVGNVSRGAAAPHQAAGFAEVFMTGAGGSKWVRPSGRRWTKARKARFIELFEQYLCVEKAARGVGMTAASAYECRSRDDDFAKSWNRALERSYDALELALIQQGLNGSERTETVHKGSADAVGQIKRVHSYSPAVAIRLLLAHRSRVEALRKVPRELEVVDDVIGHVQARMDELRARHGDAVLELDHDDDPDRAG